MTSIIRRVDLQAIAAGKLEGDVFKFTAKSISSNELCEPMMKIALEQVKGLPLIFRHRHPAGNNEKVVPIFGRAVGGKILAEGEMRYLLIDYEIPLKAPDGHELQEKKLFAAWVDASDNEGNPIGISLGLIQYLEDGKAYWVDLYEASGTHVPACVECRHVKNKKHENELGDVGLVDEKNKDKNEDKSKHEQYEAQLEKLTKEKQELEEKLAAARDAEKQVKAENGKFAADMARLTAEQQALKDRLDYAETKKPLVMAIIKAEGRPELEEFYKGQAIEYLQAQLKKLETAAVAATAIVSPKDTAGAILEEMQKKRLEANPKVDVKKTLEMVAPDLRPRMAEFFKSQGLDTEGDKK